MKPVSLFSPIFYVCLTLLFFSCEGPEGPQGPAGAAGAKGDAGASGAAGAKGDKGDTGTANVTYTDWFSPNWGQYYRFPDNLYANLNVLEADTKQPILTKAAIDKAAVHVYIKHLVIKWNTADAQYDLVERISPTSTVAWAKIPGRSTSNNSTDFFQLNSAFDAVGENYFNPYIQLSTQQWDGVQQKSVPIPELVGKTAADFRAIVKDSPQYRIVVIPGAVLAARQKAVDFNDYEAVKEAFGIAD